MTIKRYRKRPVAIEAAQWLGPNDRAGISVDELREWGAIVQPTAEWGFDYTLEIWNEPEECWVRCPVGHFVLKGVRDEFYPCDPDIFYATYEEVEV